MDWSSPTIFRGVHDQRLSLSRCHASCLGSTNDLIGKISAIGIKISVVANRNLDPDRWYFTTRIIYGIPPGKKGLFHPPKRHEKGYKFPTWLRFRSRSLPGLYFHQTGSRSKPKFWKLSNCYKTCNIADAWLKFYGKQWGVSPLLVTTFQVCSYNIAGLVAIEKFHFFLA